MAFGDGTNLLKTKNSFAIDLWTANNVTGNQKILNARFAAETLKAGTSYQLVSVDEDGTEQVVELMAMTVGSDGRIRVGTATVIEMGKTGMTNKSFDSFAVSGLDPVKTYYLRSTDGTMTVNLDVEVEEDGTFVQDIDGDRLGYTVGNADEIKFITYSVNYAFASSDETLTLPETLPALPDAPSEPQNLTWDAFANGVTNDTTYEPVAVDGGTWTFQGWKTEPVLDDTGTLKENVTVVGTWTFAPASVDPGPGPVDPQPPYIPPYVPPTPDDDIDIADEDVPLAGAIGLNLEDHFAYVAGYPDGTVHPTGNITRAEVATIFFRLLTDETRAIYWSQVNDYSDVAPENWYNNAVSTLSSMGIVSGYPDGTFRPDAPITRAEFAKIAVGFFAYQDVVYTGIFSDVADGQWWTEYIAAAVELGLVAGYPDGTFRPQANISRAESCAIVNRVLERKPHEAHLLPEEQMNLWPDNADKAAWYYADIQEATNSHDYDFIGADDLHDHEDAEQWTEKLPERDWAALEQEWSTANAAPGGEVMG